MVPLRWICGTLITGVLHSLVRGDSSHANDPDQDNWLCEACEKTSEGRTKQERVASVGTILDQIHYVFPNARQSRRTAF